MFLHLAPLGLSEHSAGGTPGDVKYEGMPWRRGTPCGKGGGQEARGELVLRPLASSRAFGERRVGPLFADT